MANYDVELNTQTSLVQKNDFNFYFWHPTLVRPARKRLFRLKATNVLGRFAPSALPHYYVKKLNVAVVVVVVVLVVVVVVGVVLGASSLAGAFRPRISPWVRVLGCTRGESSRLAPRAPGARPGTREIIYVCILVAAA